MKTFAAAVLALALVTGCKMNLTTDLYSSDLRAVKTGADGIASPAAMAFEIPSTKKCDEYTAKIQEIVAGILKDFVPKGCKSENMNSFLVADTQIPIFNTLDAWKKTDVLFGILLIERPDPEHIGVAITLDTEKYKVLTDRMNDKFHQTLDLAESKITLVLNNDERSPITFAVRDTFVNAVPVHGESEFTVERRHKADIRLSNVVAAFLEQKGIAEGFTLR